MAIRHFDHHHDTVAEVRVCSATASDRPAPTGPALMTEAQEAYVASLMKSREVPDDLRQKYLEAKETVTKASASQLIERLKAYPVLPGAANRPKGNPYPEFEDGYYALREDDGAVHFYRLSHDDREGSRYYGWPTIQAQASDDLHLIKDRERKTAIINAVNADPHAAQMLYASELGNCYVCGRTLTDEESRRLGIGPVCRGKKAA